METYNSNLFYLIFRDLRQVGPPQVPSECHSSEHEGRLRFMYIQDVIKLRMQKEFIKCH